MFYRLDKNNNIIDNANFKYAEDCLETDKNIVRDFNGKLIFEEETKTQEYLKAEQEFEKEKIKQKRIAEIKQRLDELNKDFIQSMLGADFGTKILENGTEIDVFEAKKTEFILLHNELRELEGKEPREYVKEK